MNKFTLFSFLLLTGLTTIRADFFNHYRALIQEMMDEQTLLNHKENDKAVVLTFNDIDGKEQRANLRKNRLTIQTLGQKIYITTQDRYLSVSIESHSISSKKSNSRPFFT